MWTLITFWRCHPWFPSGITLDTIHCSTILVPALEQHKFFLQSKQKSKCVKQSYDYWPQQLHHLRLRLQLWSQKNPEETSKKTYPSWWRPRFLRSWLWTSGWTVSLCFPVDPKPDRHCDLKCAVETKSQALFTDYYQSVNSTQDWLKKLY